MLPKLSPRYVPENGETPPQRKAEKAETIGEKMERKYRSKKKFEFNPETKKYERVPDSDPND
jgi:hypothetical protein